MRRLLFTLLLVAKVGAQSSGCVSTGGTSCLEASKASNSNDGAELLEKARVFGEQTRVWKAEVIETSQMIGPGMSLKSEVRTEVAAQPSLKMRRVNSGADQTIMVCNGSETFYSGDGHSYYKGEAGVTPQCDLPLVKFYKPFSNPDSIAIIGEDRVRLSDGERRCFVARAVSKRGTVNIVRTMCIDPLRPLILRDNVETDNSVTGVRFVTTITFQSFESNPTFTPDTFRFTAPPGSVEAKPPY